MSGASGSLAVEAMASLRQWANDVSVIEPFAYTVAPDGLRIVDLSNAAAPAPVGHCPVAGTTLAVAGSYAYVGGPNGLDIIDISDPMLPRQVAHHATPADATGVALIGTYAYVSWGGYGHGGGVEIVNIADPAAPCSAGQIAVPGIARDIAVSGLRAGVVWGADGDVRGGGLMVLDVGTPQSPQVVQAYGTADGLFMQLALSESYAYVASSNGLGCTLETIDVGSGGTVVSALPIFGAPSSMQIDATHLYVATWGARFSSLGHAGLLSMVDLQDPAASTLLGQCELVEDTPIRLYADTGTVYAGYGYRGLEILRISPTVFTGTGGDDTHLVRMAEDGQTLEIFENVPETGAPSYRIGREAVGGLRFAAGAGNDRITILAEVPCTILGGTGNDTISGGGAAELIRGGEGDDVLAGGGGADTLQGGWGLDELSGGDGADLLWGGAGADWMEGNGKADTLYGGGGNDTIWGGAGEDVIYGEEGDDQVDVGYWLFADSVDGGEGIDTVIGAGKEDLLERVEG